MQSLKAHLLSPHLNQKWITDALRADALKDAVFIGQERAREALAFGLGIDAKGYNLYVMGEPATGRFSLVNQHISERIAGQATPDDWCYLNNFDEAREPILLRLAAGEARQFHKDMVQLIDDLLDTFPAAFDNPGYQRKKASIARNFEQRYQKAVEEVEKFAQANQVAMYEDEGSISFAPIINGQPITDAEFARLGEEQREQFYRLLEDLESRLSESLLALPSWKRENSEALRQLNRETAEQGIKPLLKTLEHKYASELGIVKFFRQMRSHLVDTIISLLADENREEKLNDNERRALFEQYYLPNVVVSRAVNEGVPVVYEANPTYQNLFGRIEYSNQQGVAVTNYRMIRAGALHRANGGYLLLDAEQLLEQPFVWEALKLVIKRGLLKMEVPQLEPGMVNAITLMPQPMELKVKVVLLGSRDLYYTLQDYDEEFAELFRVLVDFDHDITMTRHTMQQFVYQVRRHVKEIGLAGINATAMRRLVEYSLRMAEHQFKLSAHFAEVLDLVSEAKFFCPSSTDTLDLQHIDAALLAKRSRTGRVSQSLLEDIKEGHVLIDSSGEAVGKVNGLTVMEIGGTAFGTPARITATVYAGSSGVIDIEREVELGQAIHSKGVMLLTGYLGNKYAQHFPLTLSANIALEQSYGHIDGDSASLAELVALISALTEIPARQSIAVTGSINQYGEVQAVGGVNEKIEGFFALCQYRGLTGTQGVIIPASNVLNLVLDKQVVQAVKKGLFHIYAVETVDEALSLLLGREAGAMNAKGRYPKNSINYLAVNRLYTIAMIVNGDDS